MKPGDATRPAASISSSAVHPSICPRPVMLAPRMAMSPGRRGAPVPSMITALRMMRSACCLEELPRTSAGFAMLAFPCIASRSPRHHTAGYEFAASPAGPGPDMARLRRAGPEFSRGRVSRAAAHLPEPATRSRAGSGCERREWDASCSRRPGPGAVDGASALLRRDRGLSGADFMPRRAIEPDIGLLVILRNTEPLLVHHAEAELGGSIALRGRAAVPCRGTGRVLGDASPVVVYLSDVILRRRIAVPGERLEGLQGRREIAMRIGGKAAARIVGRGRHGSGRKEEGRNKHC